MSALKIGTKNPYQFFLFHLFSTAVMCYQSLSCGASVHRKSTEKKGISWEVSRTAGIPQNQKSLASGSAYRGSNPWEAAKSNQQLTLRVARRSMHASVISHDATLDGSVTRKVPSEHVNLPVRESCLSQLPPTGSVAVIPISLDPAGLMLFSPSPRMCQAANRTCDYE